MLIMRSFFMLLLLMVPFQRVGIAAVTPTGQEAKGKSMPDKKASLDAYKIASEFLQHFPAGTDISKDQFSAQLDSATVDNLNKITITRVVNVNGHFTVTLDSAQEFKTKKANIKIGKELQFDYVQSGDTMTFTKVKGLEVKVNWFLGWMDLLDLTMTRDTTGTTIIEARVKFWGGTVKHRATIKPDGKVDVKEESDTVTAQTEKKDD